MSDRFLSPTDVEWSGNAFSGIAESSDGVAKCELVRCDDKIVWMKAAGENAHGRRLWRCCIFEELCLRMDQVPLVEVVLGPININQAKQEAALLLVCVSAWLQRGDADADLLTTSP